MHSKPLLPSVKPGRHEQNRPKTLLPSVKPGRREQFGRVTDAVWRGRMQIGRVADTVLERGWMWFGRVADAV